MKGEARPELCRNASPYVPPTVNDAQLHTSIKFLTPFSSSGTSDIGYLGACHLSTMTSPEFIEDGLWTGIHVILGDFDEDGLTVTPLHAQRFRVSSHHAHATQLKLEAESHDRPEATSITTKGYIERDTGLICLMGAPKNFIGATWFCLMTPFGIVGEWSQGGESGWVWLWKLRTDSQSYRYQLSMYQE